MRPAFPQNTIIKRKYLKKTYIYIHVKIMTNRSSEFNLHTGAVEKISKIQYSKYANQFIRQELRALQSRILQTILLYTHYKGSKVVVVVVVVVLVAC